jgi:hypothetical protein
MLITLGMIYYLYTSKTRFKKSAYIYPPCVRAKYDTDASRNSTNRAINMLITYTLNTGKSMRYNIKLIANS